MSKSKQLSGTVRTTITNNTNDDSNVFAVSLSLESDGDIPAVSTGTITGSDLLWKFDGQEDGIMYFSSSYGLGIKAGTFKTINLSVKVIFEEYIENTSFEPAIGCKQVSDLSAVTLATTGLKIGEGNTHLSGTLTIQVINGRYEPANNIDLHFSFKTDGYIPEISTATLKNGEDIWTFDGQEEDTFYFIQTSGLDIDEHNNFIISLNLKVVFEDSVSEDTTFEPIVEIMD